MLLNGMEITDLCVVEVTWELKISTLVDVSESWLPLSLSRTTFSIGSSKDKKLRDP